MDVEIFESGKKELRIEKCPDTCGRGLSDTITAACNNSRIIVEWLNHVFRIRIVICSIFGSVLVLAVLLSDHVRFLVVYHNRYRRRRQYQYAHTNSPN